MVYTSKNELASFFQMSCIQSDCPFQFPVLELTSPTSFTDVTRALDDLYLERPERKSVPSTGIRNGPISVSQRASDIVVNAHKILEKAHISKLYLLIVKILRRTQEYMRDKFSIELKRFHFKERLNEFEKIIIASYFDFRRYWKGTPGNNKNLLQV